MSATGFTKGDPQKVARAGDTMTGELILPDSSPDTALAAATKGYVDNKTAALSGSAEAQFLAVNNEVDAVSAAANNQIQALSGVYVDVTGDTMTGALTLFGNPAAALHAATKGYVDNTTVSITGNETMTGPLNMLYGAVSTDLGHDMTVVASTGVLDPGGALTLASPTSVNIPAGFAMFVNPHHIHGSPVVKTVAYGGFAVTVSNLVAPLTYFMVNSSGAIVQNAGVPTRAQRRQFAVLGRVVVLGGVITNVQDSPTLSANPVHTTLDVLSALSDVRVNGIVVTANAGTMTFAVTSGNILNLGANNVNNPDDPNVTMFNAVNPGAFRYVTQTGVVDVTPRTVIDPTIYDVAGTVTAVPGGAGTTTIQRVHCYPTQNIFIQLGQIAFGSLTAAIDAITLGDTGTTPYVTNPSLIGGGVRTAFILLTKNAANLADPSAARIARATKLGDPGGTP